MYLRFSVGPRSKQLRDRPDIKTRRVLGRFGAGGLGPKGAEGADCCGYAQNAGPDCCGYAQNVVSDC